MSPRVKLVLEGPPGAGKTTALAALVRALMDQCSFFPEPCLDVDAPAFQGTAAQQTAWYLADQRRRYRDLAAASSPVVLCDRNHLGVLAHAHAAPDGMPYRIARERFRHDIAPVMPQDLQTVILLVSTAESLMRRGSHPALPRWRRWYDRAFLDRLGDFYTRYAAELCPISPLVIDTDGLSPVEVLDVLTDRLAARGVTVETRRPHIPRVPVAPMFAHAYERAGGLGVLGRPMTDTFVHHGRHVQMFEHGALRADAVSASARGAC